MAVPLKTALDLVQAGQLGPARMALKSYLRTNAGDLDGLRLLAIVEFLDNAPNAGTVAMRKAIDLAPQRADLRHDLGTFLAGAHKHADAVKEFQEALRLAPDSAPTHLELGRALMALGRTKKAVEALREALDREPDMADAWQALAAVHLSEKQWDEALAALLQGLEHGPADPAVAADMVAGLRAVDRDSDADGLVQRACATDPSGQVTCALATQELARSGGMDMTEALWAAHRRDPMDPDILCALAEYVDRQGQLSTLIPQLARCSAANPYHSVILEWTGISLLASGGMSPAAEHMLLLAADMAWHEKRPRSRAPNALGHLYLIRGDLPNAVKWFRKVLDVDPGNATIRSNLLMALRHASTISPEELFAEHKRFGEIQESLVKPLPVPPLGPEDADRRLRIGFVSPDFKDHPVSMFFEPYLDHLNREEFELFLYYTYGQSDAVTERLKGKADHFRRINAMSARDQADMIQGDRIDILIDLAGHTAYNALPLFALKPAPIQMTWIGYPATTGLTRMDYRIGNVADQPWSTETVIPWELAFRPPADAPPVGPLPALSGRPFTFASLNKPMKASQEALDAWAGILADVPGSRLLLMAGVAATDALRQRMLPALEAHGVDPDRLTVQEHLPLRDFLALMNEVDLALDSFPYSGGTTTLLSLWMGVPVVALAGSEESSKTAAWTLRSVKLDDFIAPTVEDYRALAARHAAAPERLADLRADLRDRFRTTSVAQEQRSAGDFGGMLRGLWRAHIHTPEAPRLLRWSAARNPDAWDWSVRLRRLYSSMPEALANLPESKGAHSEIK